MAQEVQRFNSNRPAPVTALLPDVTTQTKQYIMYAERANIKYADYLARTMSSPSEKSQGAGNARFGVFKPK